ncbi:MAG: hypothetical protein DHS20C14_06260 [Phycisphaeraceae bacterium]|nr:MAG: hypothetical protein DHS20C14_06260 [Phycisphaeraceae bacterium]
MTPNPPEPNPPQPGTPPPPRPPPSQAQGDEGIETYHRVADTVGFVPNIRGKDNLFQVAAVALCTIAGVVAGLFFKTAPSTPAYIAPVIGGILGLIAGTFGSGLVLMILGWIRAAMKR